MPEDNNDNFIPERSEPITLEEEIERPKPVVEEKEGIPETEEKKDIIERPKPTKGEYAESPKKEDKKKE